jgi:hypothetical protein
MKRAGFMKCKTVKILREVDDSPVCVVAKKHGVSDQMNYGEVISSSSRRCTSAV